MIGQSRTSRSNGVGAPRPPWATTRSGLRSGLVRMRLEGRLAELEELAVDLRPGGRRSLPVLVRERVAPDVEPVEHLRRRRRAVRDRLDQEVALPPVATGQLEGHVAELGGERVVEEQHAHGRSASQARQLVEPLRQPGQRHVPIVTLADHVRGRIAQRGMSRRVVEDLPGQTNPVVGVVGRGEQAVDARAGSPRGPADRRSPGRPARRPSPEGATATRDTSGSGRRGGRCSTRTSATTDGRRRPPGTRADRGRAGGRPSGHARGNPDRGRSTSSARSTVGVAHDHGDHVRPLADQGVGQLEEAIEPTEPVEAPRHEGDDLRPLGDGPTGDRSGADRPSERRPGRRPRRGGRGNRRDTRPGYRSRCQAVGAQGTTPFSRSRRSIALAARRQW